jgi:hypothetical protein
LLANGKVLVTSVAETATSIPTAELYDYTTGQRTYTANPIYRRAALTATALRNGKVLVTGKVWRTSGPSTKAAELYEPFADTSCASRRCSPTKPPIRAR